MQGFPAEADEAAVLLLMSVVRADQKVLKEELDSIQSFFSHQLQVSQERLQVIQHQMDRYALEAIPEEKLREALCVCLLRTGHMEWKGEAGASRNAKVVQVWVDKEMESISID